MEPCPPHGTCWHGRASAAAPLTFPGRRRTFEVVRTELCEDDSVTIDANLTYEEFLAAEEGSTTAALRRLVRDASGAEERDAEAQVQWAMMQFNRACAARAAAGASSSSPPYASPVAASNQMLLRVQRPVEPAA